MLLPCPRSVHACIPQLARPAPHAPPCPAPCWTRRHGLSSHALREERPARPLLLDHRLQRRFDREERREVGRDYAGGRESGAGAQDHAGGREDGRTDGRMEGRRTVPPPGEVGQPRRGAIDRDTTSRASCGPASGVAATAGSWLRSADASVGPPSRVSAGFWKHNHRIVSPRRASETVRRLNQNETLFSPGRNKMRFYGRLCRLLQRLRTLCVPSPQPRRPPFLSRGRRDGLSPERSGSTFRGGTRRAYARRHRSLGRALSERSPSVWVHHPVTQIKVF